MYGQDKHIIHRLNLEIETSNESMAKRMYREAGSILQQYVLPRLEELLKQYDTKGQHIRLDQLTVDLSLNKSSSLENALKEQLAVLIKEQVDVVLRDEGRGEEARKDNVKISGTDEQTIEAFFYFLETGRIPWWFAMPELLADSERLIAVFTQQESFFEKKLQQTIRGNTRSLERLLQQYDQVLLSYLFSLVVPLEIFTIAQAYYKKLQMLIGQGVQDIYWQQSSWAFLWRSYPLQQAPEPRTFNVMLDKLLIKFRRDLPVGPEHIPVPGSHMQQLFKMMQEEEWTTLSTVADTGIPDEVATEIGDQVADQPEDGGVVEAKAMDKAAAEQQKQHKPEETEGEEWLADNTGLILLHPFLQYFFMELGLAQEGQFTSEQTKGTAVHLLHYLATGQERAADFELVFEKYLCGMDAATATYRYTVLTAQMKTEAETLLQSVIKHWQVLKNTTADGLREGFLQRKGKVVTKDKHNHRLFPEQNVLDILLEQVPWNISLVKLPWLDQMIHVEWMK